MKRKKYWMYFIVFFGYALIVKAQTNFAFLNLPLSARQVALGGLNVSAYGNDASMFMANPALLTDSTHLHLSANHYAYYADVGHSSAQFTAALRTGGTMGVGLQSLNYGTFSAYDASGNSQGEFRARDFALTLAYAHQISAFRLGTNLKFVQSSIAEYRSSGIFMDMGGAFFHPEKDLVVGINLKNIGFVLQRFTPTARPQIPFDAQLGVSYKPSHMPFRFSLTAHHLHRFNIGYENTQVTTDVFGNPIEERLSWGTKLLQHIVVGTELLVGKYLTFRLGYNYWQRSSLKIQERAAFVGFSYGIAVKSKNIEVGFSRATLHIAGGTNSFSVVLNTRSILKKKTVVQ
ncbi:MAG: type IX secretion system protein PorQ [Flammeovirgaceae bacterium]|nr:type IX secretion system protein PorQ [Flammeovirgaceae bacterium]MDW8287703.1 type IX secretion system protein PorQ [Flammeovirgaceae bacterium]